MPVMQIIHAMGEWIKDDDGKIYSAEEWLAKLRLSAHFLVTPSGVIIQLRDIEEIAYHAKNYNVGTVGTEYLVSGVYNYGTFLEAIKRPYLTSEQFDAGAELSIMLTEQGVMDIDRHDFLDPSRKKDPGLGFPWEEHLKAVA